MGHSICYLAAIATRIQLYSTCVSSCQHPLVSIHKYQPIHQIHFPSGSQLLPVFKALLNHAHAHHNHMLFHKNTHIPCIIPRVHKPITIHSISHSHIYPVDLSKNIHQDSANWVQKVKFHQVNIWLYPPTSNFSYLLASECQYPWLLSTKVPWFPLSPSANVNKLQDMGL